MESDIAQDMESDIDRACEDGNFCNVLDVVYFSVLNFPQLKMLTQPFCLLTRLGGRVNVFA